MWGRTLRTQKEKMLKVTATRNSFRRRPPAPLPIDVWLSPHVVCVCGVGSKRTMWHGDPIGSVHMVIYYHGTDRQTDMTENINFWQTMHAAVHMMVVS